MSSFRKIYHPLKWSPIRIHFVEFFTTLDLQANDKDVLEQICSTLDLPEASLPSGEFQARVQNVSKILGRHYLTLKLDNIAK